jgi:hypothetical protein
MNQHILKPSPLKKQKICFPFRTKYTKDIFGTNKRYRNLKCTSCNQKLDPVEIPEALYSNPLNLSNLELLMEYDQYQIKLRLCKEKHLKHCKPINTHYVYFDTNGYFV